MARVIANVGCRAATAAMFVLVAWMAAACSPLPAGSLPSANPTASWPRRGNAYLVRGWQDLYSAGIDQLAHELRDSGVPAVVYRAGQWQQLAAALGDRYSLDPFHEPLVLIGFSYGADDVVSIARRLDAHGVRVDLVITIDPVTPPRLPARVRACYNYYQTNGLWDVFPWLRGVPLKSDATGNLRNVDLRRQRPDLLEADTSHANIAGGRKLHREIVERVLAVCGTRAPSRRTD